MFTAFPLSIKSFLIISECVVLSIEFASFLVPSYSLSLKLDFLFQGFFDCRDILIVLNFVSPFYFVHSSAFNIYSSRQFILY